MTPQTFDLELITPCFCAGANQAVAEIRAPSVRGQLRWWFRALGGKPTDEALLFGSAAGESGTGSRLRLTVSDVRPAANRGLPSFTANDPESYVWHYARVSGTTERGVVGPRWQPQGVLPAGTTFKLQLLWLRPVEGLKPAFDEALSAFLGLGALGLRTTRGLGAFHCKQVTDVDPLIAVLQRNSFTIRRRTNPDDFRDYASALKDWAAWLRYRLRNDYKAKRPSPLGSSTPPSRQTSAVRFRPIKTSTGRFSWLAYEAPASRVLGNESRLNVPLLSKYSFSGPAPAAPARPRRY